jgi:hypothetical protein
VTSNAPANPAAVPARPVLRRCGCGRSPGGGECESCRRRKELRRSASARGPAVAPPIVHTVLGGPGAPLDAGVRAAMEPRFGHSFAEVRVHADGAAAESARAVAAHAYTVGPHIAFGAGRYAPGTAAGDRLIAHELAHVVQQRGSSPAIQHRLEIGAVDDPAEREAEAAADRVMAGSGVGAGALTAAGPAVRRLAATGLDPGSIAVFRAEIAAYRALAAEGVLLAEETAVVAGAVAEAEVALVATAELAAAGTTMAAGAEVATTTAVALAADDVTGVGVADDVAIPFVVAGAIGMGIAAWYLAPSAAEMSAAVSRAVEAVRRAVNLIREVVARHRNPPAPVPVPVPVPAPAPAPAPAPVPAPVPVPVPRPAPAPRPAPRPPCRVRPPGRGPSRRRSPARGRRWGRTWTSTSTTMRTSAGARCASSGRRAATTATTTSRGW